ncbi:MAG: fumarylacetoacetate hydrolase family protein [Planctomycetota bacterium]|nr:fumarylacetoacetate hydrolase family protein [Planctomycetota bacterium]MDA1248742.1 fumarylacetoacetate hydrolase family protein [Planctomycetota bacterium]
MRLARVNLSAGDTRIVSVEEDTVRLLDLEQVENIHRLCDILHAPDPNGLASFLVDRNADPIGISEVKFLAPIDQQEVWAAGVTYKRSQVARMEESESGASHYDKVYTADRPELFLKATPGPRVSGPGDPVRVRFDSSWSVPEPEFTIVAAPNGRIVGYTIGNDMSARDIEGENPLYLPQAKVYNQCCGLGPSVLLASDKFDQNSTRIDLQIHRGGELAFEGDTTLQQLHRSLKELVGWLFRENDLPNGAFLLTGTGIVPPDEFTLEDGDSVSITVTGIGTLTNPVVKAAAPE